MLHRKLFIIFLLCYTLYVRILYNIRYNETNNENLLLIAIVSCNRYNYLNRTIDSLIRHITKYEKYLLYNYVFIDQGTTERYSIVKDYNIFNSFYMNPSSYSYSFKIIFSYLYTKYIFILEEDWEVNKNIEKSIYYPSFITESILLLEKYMNVYGILLREIRDINVNYTVSVKTQMGIHSLHVLCNMKNRYAFTNGACVYRCSDLRKVKTYLSEYEVSKFFKRINYNLGFTYKGRSGKKNSSFQQSVMIHIGKKSTKSGICSISLY